MGTESQLVTQIKTKKRRNHAFSRNYRLPRELLESNENHEKLLDMFGKGGTVTGNGSTLTDIAEKS